MADRTVERSETAFALAHFAASTSAVIAAALHRDKPIGDQEIKHLLSTLATCTASAPEVARPLFDRLAETLAGKHYEDG